MVYQPLVLLARGHAAFNARHILSPCNPRSIEPVGGPFLHRLGVRFGQDGGAAVGADILRIMTDQAVTLAGDTMLDLAGGSELEAFLDAALGLQLGHFHLLDAKTRPTGPGSPCRQAGDRKSTRLNSSH